MKIKYYLSVIVVITFCSCQIEKKEVEDKEGLLWRISGNGLKKSSYMFGTMHNYSGKFLNRIPKFQVAFDSVQQLLVEKDTDVAKQIREAVDEKDKDVTLPEGLQYSDLLNQENFVYLDSICLKYLNTPLNEINMSPAKLEEEILKTVSLDNLTTALATNIKDVMLTDSISNYIVGMNGKLWQRSIDNFITLSGSEKGYNIISLDLNIDFLLWSEVSYMDATKSFICKLRNSNEITKNNFQLIRSYFDQDLTKLDYYGNNILALSGTKKIMRDKIDRHKYWIPTIKEQIHQQPSLIAVGALHLVGEYGLINVLRKEGYTVEEFK